MVTISDKAQAKIKELMVDDYLGLRVFIKGGGCHGYSYGMQLETEITDTDMVIEVNGVKVILDSASAPMLANSVVDYVDELQGAGFAIKNPQAKTTCGCGSSFST